MFLRGKLNLKSWEGLRAGKNDMVNRKGFYYLPIYVVIDLGKGLISMAEGINHTIFYYK